MRFRKTVYALCVAFLMLFGQKSWAINNTYSPTISDQDLQFYLNHPDMATAARYDLKDSAGNAMHAPSIIQMTGQSYKYAAVYHSPYQVSPGTYRYKVNLSVSNNLVDWNYIGVLIDNADMPKIALVTGSSWVVVVHEQWLGTTQASTSPSRLGYKLFYDFGDLVSRTIRASYVAPQFINPLNGTPSIYEFHLAKYGNYYSVDGQYGFHYFDGTKDVNGATTLTRLFDPTGGTVNSPSTAQAYNNLLQAQGASGGIGQRDTMLTTGARYNLQEGNIGQPGGSWDKWRIWLYKFSEPYNYPTGAGSFTLLSPQTPNGSVSFGNPSVQVVDRPFGAGKALVVSYFLFSQGAGPGEAGNLLFYYNLP